MYGQKNQTKNCTCTAARTIGKAHRTQKLTHSLIQYDKQSVIIRSSTDRHSTYASSHSDSPCTLRTPQLFLPLCLPSVRPQMFLQLRPVTCVLMLVPIVPVCLLGVSCVCDSVPAATFSGYLTAQLQPPSVQILITGVCAPVNVLHAAFQCSVRPEISALQLLGSSFHIHIGVQTPLLLQRSAWFPGVDSISIRWSCHLVPGCRCACARCICPQ